MPVVTVIMAFHRVTPFLRPAVRSILDQRMGDFEFLIVDNGTGTGLAALGEEGRDPRIRLLASPANLGVPAAHNFAREQARGEFIANMDSDDLALPSRLERQLAEFRADPVLGVLATHARVIDEAGNVLHPRFTLTSWADELSFTRYSLPVTNPTLMARRSVFAQFPMRPELPIASDYDFLSRAIEVHSCRALPEVHLHYRRHGGQMTVGRRAQMVFCASVTRLLTARRRAGRPEAFSELMTSCSEWSVTPPPPADSYAHFADLALAEGFPVLAVFFARRHFSQRLTLPGFARAAFVLAQAVAGAPAQIVLLGRMFFTGPLRTHGLRGI